MPYSGVDPGSPLLGVTCGFGWGVIRLRKFVNYEVSYFGLTRYRGLYGSQEPSVHCPTRLLALLYPLFLNVLSPDWRVSQALYSPECGSAVRATFATNVRCVGSALAETSASISSPVPDSHPQRWSQTGHRSTADFGVFRSAPVRSDASRYVERGFGSLPRTVHGSLIRRGLNVNNSSASPANRWSFGATYWAWWPSSVSEASLRRSFSGCGLSLIKLPWRSPMPAPSRSWTSCAGSWNSSGTTCAKSCRSHRVLMASLATAPRSNNFTNRSRWSRGARLQF